MRKRTVKACYIDPYWVLGLFLLLGLLRSVFAQNPGSQKEVLEVFFSRDRISVNGILDEWEDYKGITFSSSEKNDGNESNVQVQTTWDKEKLYLAFRVKDNNLIAVETSNAGSPWRDDAIGVYLSVDPVAAQENEMSPNEYQFNVNLNGAVASCRGTTAGERDHSWDADILHGVRWRGSLNDSSGSADQGYTVEIAIPWLTLGVEAQADLELLVDFSVTDRTHVDTATADLFYYDWAGLPKFGNPAKWNKMILRRAPGVGEKKLVSEKAGSRSAWVWVVIVLGLGLFGWMGYRIRKGGVKSGNLQEEVDLKKEEQSEDLESGEEQSIDDEVSDGLRILARRVKQILEEEYASDLSAASVAVRLRVSERHMRRALKAVAGQNFSKMLQGIRLQRACELLDKRELSIAEVALEVGFGEQSYFSRLFKTRYGVSPSDYRAKEKTKSE